MPVHKSAPIGASALKPLVKAFPLKRDGQKSYCIVSSKTLDHKIHPLLSDCLVLLKMCSSKLLTVGSLLATVITLSGAMSYKETGDCEVNRTLLKQA